MNWYKKAQIEEEQVPEEISRIDKAKEFGEKRHEGQYRKYNKQPYFTHPSKVADIVKTLTSDEDVIIAAYLHDTLEDTSTTYEELANKFSPKVASLVKELSSSKEGIAEVGKAQYLLNKMMSMSPDALLIKLADRYDNTSGFAKDRELLKDDNHNLQKLNSFIDKYKKETQYILDNLKCPLTSVHNTIINMIRHNIT